MSAELHVVGATIQGCVSTGTWDVLDGLGTLGTQAKVTASVQQEGVGWVGPSLWCF